MFYVNRFQFKFRLNFIFLKEDKKLILHYTLKVSNSPMSISQISIHLSPNNKSTRILLFLTKVKIH